MLAAKLFQLLSRSEIEDIALRSGEPPRALYQGSYKRISPQPLAEGDILDIMAAARGHDHMADLDEGARWRCQLPKCGLVDVSAGYENGLLWMRMRRAAEPAAAAPSPPSPPSPAHAQPRAEPAPESPRKPPRRAPSENVWMPEAAPPPIESLDAPPPGRPAASPVVAAPAPRPAPAPLEAKSSLTELSSAFEELSPKRPAHALEPAPPREMRAQSPAASDAGFDYGETPVLAPADLRAPSQPLVQPEVVTAHDAFSFETTHRWASVPPPQYDGAAPAARAPKAKPTRKRYVGDMLDDLLGAAREQRASDVHVIAGRPALFRIAGELLPQTDALAADIVEHLVMLRVPELGKEQLESQGSADFSLIHPAYGRFRANVSRQRTGWKLTARPIGEEIPTLDELGLPQSVANALAYHQGLIVVTGPTGHGKTTTLAAIVGIINRETTHHVITVEDPIEFVHPTAKAIISQREVGTHTKTFQAALKGSLREDPDVIVVGELRDTETVRMALTASETGHLVVSTMNTPSAAKAIDRLIDLFPPGDQPQVRMTLAGGLRLIVSQRLVPSGDRTQLHAAAEVLPGSVPLWNLIRENRTYQIASLQQRGKSLGIIRLDDSLAQLVRAGKTTLEIAREFAEQPEHFEALVAGRKVPVPGAEADPTKVAPGNAAQAGAAKPKPGNAAAQATAAAQNAQKAAKEAGKSVLSRATKLFGG